MPNGAPVLVLILQHGVKSDLVADQTTERPGDRSSHPNAAPQQAPITMTTIPAMTRSHDMVTLPLRDLASSSFCVQDL